MAEILTEVAQSRTRWAKLFHRFGVLFRDKLGLTWKALGKHHVLDFVEVGFQGIL
jgi:hypothetical protein